MAKKNIEGRGVEVGRTVARTERMDGGRWDPRKDVGWGVRGGRVSSPGQPWGQLHTQYFLIHLSVHKH